MSDTPTLEELLNAVADRSLRGAFTSMPGRVVRYNSSTQSVDVEITVLDSDGPFPVVQRCPLMFPGSAGSRITWPVSAGDGVLLVFASRSIDKWLAVGGVVDPEDDRHHTVSDAIAIPGLFDFAHLPTSVPSDAFVVHASKIRLGGPSANDPVIRKSDLDDFITSYFNVHVHVETSTTTLVPTVTVTTLPSGSSVVKVP